MGGMQAFKRDFRVWVERTRSRLGIPVIVMSHELSICYHIWYEMQVRFVAQHLPYCWMIITPLIAICG